MNNDYFLMIEMFDGVTLESAPPLGFSGEQLDATMKAIDERNERTSAVREIYFKDFVQAVLGDIPEPAAATVPVTDSFVKAMVGSVLPTPTPLGPKPGHIPSTPTPIRPVRVPKHRAALERILKPIMAKVAPKRVFSCDAWSDFLDSSEALVVNAVLAAKG